jgi:hypothetical protein
VSAAPAHLAGEHEHEHALATRADGTKVSCRSCDIRAAEADLDISGRCRLVTDLCLYCHE